ncbi:MAG: amidophosphoribosyltransferase [Firmicutes bacterium]|nr:amidophosphoribosyltransferase [Bacillota bacterium]
MKNRRKINEECAVFGVSLKTSVEAAGLVYNGLLSLQHRGQEGAGIAVVANGSIECKKNVGLVSEVFSAHTLAALHKGNTAVGHTRYSTTGSDQKANMGPFVTEYLTGRIATAHNGNITNAKELRGMLQHCGLRFNSTSDSEVVASLLAYRIIKEKNIFKGIKKAVSELEGAFSLAVADADGHLFAIRDPHGFRPLVLGKSKEGIAVASESCAFDACGFELIKDVLPGEMVIIKDGEILRTEQSGAKTENGLGLCIFEYVYFARPDSVIDGLSVYEARFNMGAVLADEHPKFADVVCGVPDSGLDAAAGYAAASGLPLVTGFIKNRYIGRSFIYPTQSKRDSAVKLKLNPLAASIRGKKVVLVDDSIVRGTTSEKIVKSLKNAGAKEVHLRISSPPFLFACRYGTDIDSIDKLIANNLSLDEICRKIGADSLGYISIEGLKRACGKNKRSFCTACFTGENGKKSVCKDSLEEKTV